VVTGAGAEWKAEPDCLRTSLNLEQGEERRLRLLVTACGDPDIPAVSGLRARASTIQRWRTRVSRVRTSGDVPFGRMVNHAMSDLGAFALLEGQADEWLAPAAGAPLYPALFGRDSLTCAWQATVLVNG
jgi:hypothetical protein